MTDDVARDTESAPLVGDYACPVCTARIRHLVRVGHTLYADPCEHPTLDLLTLDWFRRQYLPYQPPRPRRNMRQTKEGTQ